MRRGKPLMGIFHYAALIFVSLQLAQSVHAQVTPKETILLPNIILNSLAGTKACDLMNPIAGICIWLVPQPLPHFETSLEVAHFQPDTVVSIYNHAGAVPWLEMAQTTGVLAATTLKTIAGVQSLSGGGAAPRRGVSQDIFKEAAVHGHPLSLNLGQSSLYGRLAPFFGGIPSHRCPSGNFPLFPYFHSEIDATVWRKIVPLVNLGEKLVGEISSRVLGIEGVRVIGQLFPINGTVATNIRPFATLTVAARAIYLVNGGTTLLSNFEHLFLKIGDDCGDRDCDTFMMEQEDQASRGIVQPLFPLPVPACGIIGQSPLVFEPWIQNQTASDTGVFALWRCYRCCTPVSGGQFIAKVSFGVECPQGEVVKAAKVSGPQTGVGN